MGGLVNFIKFVNKISSNLISVENTISIILLNFCNPGPPSSNKSSKMEKFRVAISFLQPQLPRLLLPLDPPAPTIHQALDFSVCWVGALSCTSLIFSSSSLILDLAKPNCILFHILSSYLACCIFLSNLKLWDPSKCLCQACSINYFWTCGISRPHSFEPKWFGPQHVFHMGVMKNRIMIRGGGY